MYRRTLVFALALSVIVGVDIALAQSVPDTTSAPAPAAPAQTAPAPAAPAQTAPAPAAPVQATPPAPAPTAAAAPAPVKPASVYYEKARVVVDGEAEANGSLAMTFTPQGGEGRTFTVNVLVKAKKKDVARDIHKELSILAGSAYKIKLDNEKIHISKVDKKTTPTFALSVDKLEVGGISVRVEKD